MKLNELDVNEKKNKKNQFDTNQGRRRQNKKYSTFFTK